MSSPATFIEFSRLRALSSKSEMQKVELNLNEVVADVDVGLTPVDVTRPPGTYRVAISRAGYARFQNDITLAPCSTSSA